jgi:LysM repeat protein
MVARNRARYLAPIALAASIAGTYFVVHAGLTTTSHVTSQSHAHRAGGHNASRRKFARAKFYVVQPGDSLTSIAAKTGIAITTLESLNPNLDPNNLQTAQRLRLRR